MSFDFSRDASIKWGPIIGRRKSEKVGNPGLGMPGARWSRIASFTG